MKVLKPIGWFILCLLFAFQSFAQEMIGSIPSAIKTANASTVAKNFDKRVDITINDNADNYSKEQGEIILKNFLNKFTSRDFSVVHKGNSPDGSQYLIGSMKTNSGNFRTYFYIKKSDGGSYIQEIRFEKE